MQHRFIFKGGWEVSLVLYVGRYTGNMLWMHWILYGTKCTVSGRPLNLTSQAHYCTTTKLLARPNKAN